ncbi:MAG: hypothetical protein AB7U79_06000 [Candidatus Izemoplasmatales bacterium]
MNEFTPLNLNYKDTQNNFQNDSEKTFQSKLGDFSHLEERVILFGRSKMMKSFFILFIITTILSLIPICILLFTDLSYINRGVTTSMNWIKIFLVISFFIALILPLSAYHYVVGSQKLNTAQILKALGLLDIYLAIIQVILLICAVLCIIGFLFLLFSSFILVIILGLIVYGLLYMLYRFIKRAKEISTSISFAFLNHGVPMEHYPDIIGLRIFIVGFAILEIVNFISNLGDSSALSDQIGISFASALDTVSLFDTISFIAGMIMFIFFYNLLGNLDSFLRVGKPAYSKPMNTRTTTSSINPQKRTVSTEDDWHL